MKNADFLEAAIRVIEHKGGRLTAQRRAIIETAFAQEKPYTAEDLYDIARSRNESVSRATVYRTLPLLLETNLLRKITLLDNEPALYEPNLTEQGYHSFIWCTDCDRMIEFDDHCLDLREASLIKNLGFRARDIRLRVDATCEEFHRTGKCRRREEAFSS
jgi:Fur family ferric uptake transcriptional regulator